MKRLVIVGNGFDLGHKMKTNFVDFINSNYEVLYDKYKELKNGTDSWGEIETNYKNILNALMLKYVDTFFVDDEVVKITQENGVNDYGEIDYWGEDRGIFNKAISEITCWVSLLEDFEKDFLLYLNTNYNDMYIRDNVKKYEKLAEIINSADLILTFNYTNTIEELYRKEQVFHIHGNIDEQIIIGCDTIEKISETIVDGEYPSKESFEKTKHGLQEKMSYYDFDMEDNLVPNQDRLRVFNFVKSIAEKHEKQLKELLIKKSKDFLTTRKKIIEKLLNEVIEEIIIIGHSISEVDISVFESINNFARVIYYYHDENEIELRRLRLSRFENKIFISDWDLYK